MKNSNILIYASVSLIILLSLLIEGCKSSEPGVKEVQLQKLKSKTWAIQSVTVDDVDITNSFTGFTLKFTDGDYTTTNAGLLWAATGHWSFSDDQATSILRNDNIVVSITDISDISLILELDWATTTLGGGRIASLKGHYKFTFK